MKTLILTLALIIFSFAQAQAQTVDEIFKEKIQPRRSVEILKQGLEEVEKACEVESNENCSSIKAMGNYLIADRYFAVTHSVSSVDLEIAKMLFKKANYYYDIASQLKPIDEFKASQKYLLTDNKSNLESDKLVAQLLLEN